MMNDAVTDEELMAFADGALAPDRAATVQKAVDADPALAARAQMFRDSAALLADLGQALPSDVPDTVIARVHELAAAAAPVAAAPVAAPPIVDLAAHRAARRVPFWQVPLAASICLAIGVAGTMALRPNTADQGAGHLAALESAPVLDALRTLPSGEVRQLDRGRVTMIGSFTNAENEFCREFEYDPPTGQTVVSVSCHAGAWGVRMAVMAAPVDATGYAPASSLEVLDAYLAASGAGPQMDPNEEAAALQQLP